MAAKKKRPQEEDSITPKPLAEPWAKPSDPWESATIWSNHNTSDHADYNPNEITSQATASDAAWVVRAAREKRQALKDNQPALSKARAKKQVDDGDIVREGYRELARKILVELRKSRPHRSVPIKTLAADSIKRRAEEKLPPRSQGTVEKYLANLDWR